MGVVALIILIHTLSLSLSLSQQHCIFTSSIDKKEVARNYSLFQCKHNVRQWVQIHYSRSLLIK